MSTTDKKPGQIFREIRAARGEEGKSVLTIESIIDAMNIYGEQVFNASRETEKYNDEVDAKYDNYTAYKNSLYDVVASSTKSITLNGIVFCQYEVGGEKEGMEGVLFLKVSRVIGNLTVQESEDIYIQIISILEGKTFTNAAYLNI